MWSWRLSRDSPEGLTLGQADVCTSSSHTCVRTPNAGIPGPKVQLETFPAFEIKHMNSLCFSGLPVSPSGHPSPEVVRYKLTPPRGQRAALHLISQGTWPATAHISPGFLQSGVDTSHPFLQSSVALWAEPAVFLHNQEACKLAPSSAPPSMLPTPEQASLTKASAFPTPTAFPTAQVPRLRSKP